MAGRHGYRMRRSLLRRTGHGLVPGGRGFIGGGGGVSHVVGHAALLPFHMLMALVRLAALLKLKHHHHRARVARHKAVRVRHMRARKGPHPRKLRAVEPAGRHGTHGKQQRRANLTYTTGVFNVSNGRLKRTRLLG